MAAEEVMAEEKCFELKGTAVNITMPDTPLTINLRLTLKSDKISGGS
jgi:hypothetical protein